MCWHCQDQIGQKIELDWVETSMSRDVLIQASMLPDTVRNANEDEVALCNFAVNALFTVYACILYDTHMIAQK